TNDAYHMTAPRADGADAARAITLALSDSGLTASDIDYVSAHATGTPLGDAAEACALLRGLGSRGRDVHVSGTKGLHGHALGASGAIEAAITVLALARGFLPGTTNLRSPDQDCRLNLVPAEGIDVSVRAAISTSFGFGGANAALVLRAMQPD
ncbi:MAG: beta-ketoacyl-[acyl-carrier-protein] synthase II, partial [Chloroflexota bacterium]